MIAVDEDGQSVPVSLDEATGEVVVTPGTSVDEPITVTVPVEGHAAGRDDNNSEATTVDPSGVVAVQPANEPQDTGIDVVNPSEDTSVSAVDEDRKDVPAHIDEVGNVVVTPGENVDGPITVTVTDPNLPGGSTTVTVPVEGHGTKVDDSSLDESLEIEGEKLPDTATSTWTIGLLGLSSLISGGLAKLVDKKRKNKS